MQTTNSQTSNRALAGQYREEAQDAEAQAREDHARADAMTDAAGETTEASGYYRMRAQWAEQIARNRRESAEYFGAE